MTCRIFSIFRMLLSRLRQENDVIDEVTIHQLSITDGNTSQKKIKKRRIVNFVIMYNVNRCAIYITLNSTVSTKSCRKCPKIKHAQYKYTMCYRTFVLVLFIVLYLQNRAFSKWVISIFDLRVMSLDARHCQFRFRMNVNRKRK